MRLRTQMLASMLIVCSPATWASELVAAQVVPMAAQLRSAPEAGSLEQQVVALQKQVSSLQAQMNALLSAVKVTETGVVVQGPAVTIHGGRIDVRSDGTLALKTVDMAAEVARTTDWKSGMTTTISSSSGTTLQASGPIDIKGSLVRLNNGARAVATVGSTVMNGQVINGSGTVFAD